MMMNARIDHGDAVYRKTDMGREILQGGRRRLPLRHRQLLVLMDGTRSIGMLRTMLDGADRDLEAMVQDLHREGLVTTDAATAPAASSPVAAASPTTRTSPDPGQLARAKALMLDTARACLGVLAEKLTREIAGAQDDAQLRKAMAHWNMALRESLRGADTASRYMEEVQAILGWNG